MTRSEDWGWVMFGRLLRVTGTVLVIAVAFVTPVLATSTPASADTVVNGCTIVSNPTATNFTNCPGADFSGANLSGVDLSFANLQGAQFVSCPILPSTSCAAADLSGANFSSANLMQVSFANCPPLGQLVADCNGANLSGTNFTTADLSHAILAQCGGTGPNVPGQTQCLGAFADGAVFVQANLTSAQLANCITSAFDFAFCGAISLSNGDLSGANLTGAIVGDCLLADGGGAGSRACAGVDVNSVNLTGANLTGANLTATSLVPSDQTVNATSPAGAVVTWPTPPSLPGATPGSCSPASGSTFPISASVFVATTVTCQVLDDHGDVATGTFIVQVNEVSTFVGLPSNGATITGGSWLDAAAQSPFGISSVNFRLSGGSLSSPQLISGSTPTFYGYLGGWNSASVPNGTYTIQSVATDGNGVSTTSAPITVTVNNPITTAVVIPSDGATLSGTSALLVASAPGASSVNFELTGGTLSNQVVATGTDSIWGWYVQWNSASVANGTYTLQSVATEADGTIVTSAPIGITVSN